jgi:penicillin-binding protein 1C
VGLIGDWVLAVWVGNFSGEGNPALIGRSAAGPLFFHIARTLPHPSSHHYDPRQPDPELNLTRVTLCQRTGELPEQACPATETGWFIPGVSPIRVSHVFRHLPIDIRSGLQSCSPDPTTTRYEVFEFWPSDYHALWQQAGISLRTPPPLMPGCSPHSNLQINDPPLILSPDSRVTYAFTDPEHALTSLPFQAITHGSSQTVYWFVNQRFVGQSRSNTPFFWTPTPGTFYITAVDDQGNGSSVTIEVAFSRPVLFD